jgi:hypothetical protein
LDTLDLYSEILHNDSHLESSDAFIAVLKPLKAQIQGAKWDRLSLGIFKTFLKDDVNRHYAMKIFLMNKNAPVISPLLMYQAFDAI